MGGSILFFGYVPYTHPCTQTILYVRLPRAFGCFLGWTTDRCGMSNIRILSGEGDRAPWWASRAGKDAEPHPLQVWGSKNDAYKEEGQEDLHSLHTGRLAYNPSKICAEYGSPTDGHNVQTPVFPSQHFFRHFGLDLPQDFPNTLVRRLYPIFSLGTPTQLQRPFAGSLPDLF